MQKAKIITPRIDDGPPECKRIDPDYKKELSELSEASDHEPGVKYYESATNAKGKICTKSRRCIECNKLSMSYYNCCNKTYSYSVGRKKHYCTFLVDHIKEMK